MQTYNNIEYLGKEVNMKINSVAVHPMCKTKKEVETSFKASPNDILKAGLTKGLCFEQRNLLESVGTIYEEAEKIIKKKIDINLIGKSELPKDIANIEIYGRTVGEVKQVLQEQKFSCVAEKSSENCGDCEKVLFGELVANILKDLGVKNPTKIELTPKSYKHFFCSLFNIK